jgi:hypothetical protein
MGPDRDACGSPSRAKILDANEAKSSRDRLPPVTPRAGSAWRRRSATSSTSRRRNDSVDATADERLLAIAARRHCFARVAVGGHPALTRSSAAAARNTRAAARLS